jgi:hypothetical protein
MSDINGLSIMYILAFIIAVLVLYEISGAKATTYFLILVLIGSAVSHMDVIKELFASITTIGG